MNQEKEIIVGGQAVIEGVMMRAPNSCAVAVRRRDGSIVSKSERLPKLVNTQSLKRPCSGPVLVHSMMLGVKALNSPRRSRLKTRWTKRRSHRRPFKRRRRQGVDDYRSRNRISGSVAGTGRREAVEV